ncbi:hypothetical protein SLS53_004556 [Cytospora paraplurivora]|uniref:Cytochrome P450 n=1 Tax=Cytospora paraplurivora TaxID=2898453 RepID=A0AAN9U878_9PEZI
MVGDVVRIGPNEVVFITPKASEVLEAEVDTKVPDIYDSHTKHLEHFTRTDWLDLGEGEDGINWERDPVKHRQVRKNLSPAFSVQSLNAKEPTLHKHIDYFLERMREFGNKENGIELREVNFFLAINAVTKKFRSLAPLKFLFVPPSILATLPQTLALNHKEVVTRINRRGNTTHLDYFEHLCPPDAPEPNNKQLKHMEIVAGQLLSAGYEPISSQFMCTLIFLIQDTGSYRHLVEEIRNNFKSNYEINTEAVAHLQFLNACLTETLRITVIGAGGLPRISPGAFVDGHYIDKGITVQYGHFAFTRSPHYFHDPDKFRPQRWLPHDHRYWDSAFVNDAREAFHPFSRGPRSCPGKGSAWRQTRVFIAKVLWNFDIERVPGEEVVFDRDFRSYAMWDKPKIRARFRPVEREHH